MVGCRRMSHIWCARKATDRPFQRLTGLRTRSKPHHLQRVLTDFGAEKSFAQASEQLLEHYGVDLHRSSVRQVVERQAGRAEEFVAAEHEKAQRAYQSRPGHWPGVSAATQPSVLCGVALYTWPQSRANAIRNRYAASRVTTLPSSARGIAAQRGRPER